MERQHKLHVFYGKIFPIIVLVVIPLAVTILQYMIPQSPIYSVFGYNLLPIDLLYVLVFAYALSPIKYSSNKYFQKKRFKNTIVEYEYVKKILYVIVPIFIFFVIIERSFRTEFLILLALYTPIEDVINFDAYFAFLSTGINLSYSVIAGVIWIVLHVGRKEFRFYFAKACFAIISEKLDQITRAKYLIIGIKSYDKYLQRNLKIQIKDIKRIYSKIISDSNIEENEVIKSISTAFESNDRLKPAKCLSKILNVQDTENFLIDRSYEEKIKELAILFATIVPVVIAIIQLLLPTSK